MKLSMSLIVLGTLIAVFPLVSVELNDVDYGSLIRNVYDKYTSTGVIIALAEKIPPFGTMTTWYGVTRILSDEGISTLIVDFGQFENRLKFYSEKNNPPLIVIVLETIEALHSFQSIIENLKTDYAIWLIFFSRDGGQDVCQFCHEPHGNSFNLKFNSKVLTSCCDSNKIEAWWSIKKNRTKTQEFGRLIRRLGDGNIGIDWFPDELVYHRRYSLDGRVLRIAAVKDTNIFEERDGDYYGVLGDILKEMSQAMNFTVSEIIWDDYYGLLNPETSNSTGLLGRIQQRKADIGVGAFVMDSDRFDVVHFTCPIAFGNYYLYIRKLDITHLPWNAYFKALASDVWMVIIGLILTTPILITLIKYKRNYHFFPLLCEQYLNVWGIFCQQGLPDFPEETSLRMIYVSIFISAMVTSSAYSASIIRSLSVSSSSPPFTTMEQFIEDGTYGLIVYKNGITHNRLQLSNRTLLKKMMSLMRPADSLPRNSQEGFEQVCSDRVALYAHDLSEKGVKSLPCELTSIRTGKMESFAMIMPNNSEYVKLVNYHLQEFRYNGIFERLERKYYTKLQESKLSRPPVQLQELAPILCAVAIGIIIAFIIFIIERHSYPSAKKLRDRKIRIMEESAKKFDFHGTKKRITESTSNLHYPGDF